MERVGQVSNELHERLGSRILQTWGMPELFWKVAESHHERGDDSEPITLQRRLVEAAWVAAVQEIGEYLPALPEPLRADKAQRDDRTRSFH